MLFYNLLTGSNDGAYVTLVFSSFYLLQVFTVDTFHVQLTSEKYYAVSRKGIFLK
ncbi:hypothetical protein [Paenibacillus sp. IITD108]|uniref:hypothetical protein n=1 Tax=Paenibacillus sp. IITD108 TaxID=3116649 RepID=UPI002F411590